MAPHPNPIIVQNALPFMALYGLMMLGPISYWNAFGFDRAAIQGYFSWPIPFRDALVARNITVALLAVLPPAFGFRNPPATKIAGATG